MRGFLKILGIGLVVFGVFGFVVLGQDDEPRTWYESLALDTPEAALETFVDAFQRQDFPTVFLVLAPQAQFRWMQTVNLLRFGHLVQEEQWEAIEERVPTFAEGLGHGEHSDGMVSYLFDEIMLAAQEVDGLLTDLSGEVTVLESESSQTPDGDAATDIITTVEGIEGTVIFRMVHAPRGRWRVLQVIVPDGDEQRLPWSVPVEREQSE